MNRHCEQQENQEHTGNHILSERLELSDTMLDLPMQTGRPNGVRSSDWLGLILGFRQVVFSRSFPTNLEEGLQSCKFAVELDNNSRGHPRYC